MSDNKIIIGRFGKVHGIKGWITIISFATPKENILQLRPWYLNKNDHWQQIELTGNKILGKHIAVKLPDIDDCDDLAQTDIDDYQAIIDGLDCDAL